MARCLLLLIVLPVLVLCQPGPDNLVLNECLEDSITIRNIPIIGHIDISGIPRACVSGTISRCDSLNVSVHIALGNVFNRTINISRGDNMDPAFAFSFPASSVCSDPVHATLHVNPHDWKLTPSYVRIHPYIQFDTPCRISIAGVHQDVTIPTIGRNFSVGADCSVATSCSTCADMREPGGAHPCGWCQSSHTCFPSNDQNQPYCVEPCSTMGGLLRSNQQCQAAQQAQSTSDSTWSAGKTATVVVLAIVLPILVIIVALCLRRSYNRHHAPKGTTSGVGSIQAHAQGYRPTSESVSTEVSANASTTAEFRQLEGYNPPSTRDSHV